MPAYAVIGGQWGDEGKGKVVDYCASDARVLNPEIKSKKAVPVDIVVRFNGGNNAGHTVFNPAGEFKLHLVPCGIAIPGVELNIIGPGCAVDPVALVDELETTSRILGVPVEDLLERLMVSPKTHLVFPWHIAEDMALEILRDNLEIGTTKRGMGPVFADKALRIGFRVGEVLDTKVFSDNFASAWKKKAEQFNNFYLDYIVDALNLPKQDEQDLRHKLVLAFQGGYEKGFYKKILDQVIAFAEKFRKRIQNVEYLLQEANAQGKNILFEGAQGALLDIDHGTYPYVTSSHCGISAAYGSGIDRFDKVIGVFKFPYCTRVGGGPFPSEMRDEDAETAVHIRDIANEYGVTTGRPRRIGWFDYTAAKYSLMINGATHLALTRLDIFDEEKTIKVGVGYDCMHNGFAAGKAMPQVNDLYCQDFNHVMQNGEVRAVLAERDGWADRGGKVHGKRRFANLPQEAQKLCLETEEKTGMPILLVSTGAKRQETIVMSSH